MASAHTPHIVVLGAGFGGLYTVLHLAKALRRRQNRPRMTLIDRQNYFLFTPILHEVAVGAVSAHHVIHPIRQFLRGLPVDFQQATVTDIDLPARAIRTTQGEFNYDYLVIALGSVTNYFGMESVARHALTMKTVEDAVRLRNHLIAVFEKAAATTDPAARRRLLTFVQAGAGFTGIETFTDVRDFIHHVLLRDYPMIRAEELRFLLVDGLPCLQCITDPGLARVAMRVIEGKGIDVRFNTLVRDAGPGWVQLNDGARLETDTLLWSAGVTTNPVVAALPVEKGAMGRLKVLPTLQLPDYPEVFVAGDNAYLEENGMELPPTAQVANQQSPRLAMNLLNILRGQAPRPFVFHKLGELATLGMYRAVAQMGPIKFSGFLAWLAWRGAYLYRMPWWSGKFRVAADWLLDWCFPPDTSFVDVPSANCVEKEHANE